MVDAIEDLLPQGNRLNVFFLSISIKGLAGIVLLITLIPFYVELIVSEIATKSGQIENYVRTLII